MDLVTPMAESASLWLTSGLLAIAGLYQFSPLKQVCLRYCRSPIGFLMMEWRPGISGAWVMGLKHGSYCLGCCWAVCCSCSSRRYESGLDRFFDGHRCREKLLPPTTWVSRSLGALFLLAGFVVLATR